jgi:polyhydroxyalkanoate synthesis regulator phasin
MKKKLLVGAGVALIVLLLAGLGGAAFVFAQEPTPPIPFGWHGGGRGMGGFGRGGFGWAGGGPWTMFDTAAETLGLTPEELFAELRAGKSPAEIAEEQGVDVEALYDAVNAARGEAMQQAIEQAVEDGRLTQEQADQMLERLESGPASPEEMVEARKQAIQQAVEDGRMTQEQADWMLEGLEHGWGGGRGFGRGFGHKGCPPLESE